MIMVKGTELSGEDQREVLSSYVHRYTQEHKPAWANDKMPNGDTYKPQFSDDKDWLANTKFAVCKSGRLSRKVTHCESNPTWPEGS